MQYLSFSVDLAHYDQTVGYDNSLDNLVSNNTWF